MKLLAPVEEDKSLKSRENYVYLLYRDTVINTSLGAIAEVNGVFVPSKQFKEATLTHLFNYIYTYFCLSLLRHFEKEISVRFPFEFYVTCVVTCETLGTV